MEKDLTPEEIEEMYQRNENFSGSRADFGKIRLYQEIKGELVDFLQSCDDVIKLSESKINPHEKNAMFYLDIKHISTFDRTELAKLTSIMSKVDLVVICSGTRRDYIRVSFGIENIWAE